MRRSGIRTGGGAAFGALNQRRAIELRYACTLVGVPGAVGGWMHWHAACHSSVDVPSSLGTISVSRTSGSGQRWESGDPQPISHALLVLAVDEACGDVGPGSCPQILVAGSSMFTWKTVQYLDGIEHASALHAKLLRVKDEVGCLLLTTAAGTSSKRAFSGDRHLKKQTLLRHDSEGNLSS